MISLIRLLQELYHCPYLLKANCLQLCAKCKSPLEINTTLCWMTYATHIHNAGTVDTFITQMLQSENENVNSTETEELAEDSARQSNEGTTVPQPAD